MKSSKIGATIAAFSMIASTAMAAVPAGMTSLATPATSTAIPPIEKPAILQLGLQKGEIKGPTHGGNVQLASFADGCNDPNYSWWEYSGWEAIACLGSGQW
ncbi:hypothetical protein RMR21_025830 (plasmid) [Agrobacterium sp. rho-8.1]|nr:hypothetical protein [Agrobacterium sp. rho-8.1]